MALFYKSDVRNEIDAATMKAIRKVLCTTEELHEDSDVIIRNRIAGIIDMADVMREHFADDKEGD